MKNFLSCDWGTTNFRLRLIDIASGTIIAEFTGDEGISSTYNNWTISGLTSEERVSFYQSIIASAIKELEAQVGQSLFNSPLIISGMASSSIGMLELPYKQIPVSLQAMNLEYVVLEPTKNFNHATLIISGLKTDNDVMRGEETKIAGCYQTGSTDKQLFILPGTHPKHVSIESSNIISFSTYLTGELFQLLSAHSILKDSVEAASFSQHHKKAFNDGVSTGSSSNVLNSIFTIRTNQLFNKYNKEENYFYLSGLLIGQELSGVIHMNIDAIVLITNKTFELLYTAALALLCPNRSLQIVDSDDSLVRGQLKIAKTLNYI